MKRLILLVVACVFVVYVHAQNDTISRQVIATAGHDTVVNGVSVSWTLGEVAVGTIANEDSTIILTQGFQQGYFEITSIGDPLSDEFELKVYPNPASEYIWVDLKSNEIKSSLIEIYTMEGKLVYTENWEFANGANQIMLNGLNASQYILRVSDKNGRVLQTFKLIKR